MADTGAPLTNGDNGRDRRGRFGAGNPGGPGNPNARTVGAWRKALVRAVPPADFEAVVRVVLERAKAGEPWAVREILDRCLGRPGQANERAEPLTGQPPVEVDCRIDLSAVLADGLREAARHPCVPGLPLFLPTPPVGAAPHTGETAREPAASTGR